MIDLVVWLNMMFLFIEIICVYLNMWFWLKKNFIIIMIDWNRKVVYLRSNVFVLFIEKIF